MPERFALAALVVCPPGGHHDVQQDAAVNVMRVPISCTYLSECQIKPEISTHGFLSEGIHFRNAHVQFCKAIWRGDFA